MAAAIVVTARKVLGEGYQIADLDAIVDAADSLAGTTIRFRDAAKTGKIEGRDAYDEWAFRLEDAAADLISMLQKMRLVHD